MVGHQGITETFTLKSLTDEEYLLPGNAACPGCAAVMAMRIGLKALGPRTALIVPACCMSVAQGHYPKTPSKVPVFNTAFAASAATASGIRAALEMKGITDVYVVCWAGDGGTADIGIQSLSGAAERGDDLIYICYDNEAYMNTGTQRSSSTPEGARTTTTITGKAERKKDVPGIMMAHRIPYVATACASYPLDFANKLRRAVSIKGTRYIHLLSPCPPGWRYPSEKTVEVGRLAVETGAWILYEWTGGRCRLTGPSSGLADRSRRRPLEEYLRIQGRFSEADPSKIEAMKKRIDEEWEMILELCKG